MRPREEGGDVTGEDAGGSLRHFGCRITSRLKIPLDGKCGNSLATGRGKSINNCVIGGVVRTRRERVTNGKRGVRWPAYPGMRGGGTNLYRKSLLFLLPRSAGSFLGTILPRATSFSFTRYSIQILSIPNLPRRLFLLLPGPPTTPPRPNGCPPTRVPSLRSTKCQGGLPIHMVSGPRSRWGDHHLVCLVFPSIFLLS